MRVLHYSMKLQLFPWATYELVPIKIVKETDVLNKECFDMIVSKVIAMGFDYSIAERPDDILLEYGPKNV